MRLLELSSKGFRIPDASYALSERGGARPLVVVKGSPGSGKTTLLRLIAGAKEAFAPYGSAPDLRPLLRADQTGHLVLTLELDAEELAQAKLASAAQTISVRVEPSGTVCSGAPELAAWLARHGEGGLGARWELFPAHRRLDLGEWQHPHPPLSADLEASRRLAVDSDKYLALRRVLHDVALAESRRVARELGERGVVLTGDDGANLTAWRAAVATMLPGLRLVSLGLGERSACPTFLRRSGERVTIAELSASEEQAVLFAFAFTWLGLSGGVALVDGPELHHASGEQAGFVECLAKLAAGAQLVLATGSREVAALPGAHVIDLDGRAGLHP
jgi:energy-coupling factor transporter ATP-binding protein EcfA2